MIKRVILFSILAFIFLAVFQYCNSGKKEDVYYANDFEIVAHRGVHQNYHKEDMNWKTTCTASRIYKPTHAFLENTIESISAAFNQGATIVEIDINRTSDDHLVLFHDWMLECRTNGKGKISDYPLEYLITLDVGYNYTYDNGKTFPFRGKGIGKMPTLRGVLEEFPNKKFIIDHKDGSVKTALLLKELLNSLPPKQIELLYYYGPQKPFEKINQDLPEYKRFYANRGQIKKWFINYMLSFGLFGFPEESSGYVIILPPKYGKFLWGWPYTFINKVHEAGAKIYFLIDTEEEARKYKYIGGDGIMTDYIEVVGKYYMN